jgi:predicted phage terminase large subunit-like protein
MRFPSLGQLDAEIARRSFAEFTQQAWHIIEPAKPLVWNWHMQAMCDHAQALLEKRLGTFNLLYNVPPGTSKSTIICVMMTPWWWLHQPGWRAQFASGNEVVSLRDSKKCRDIIESHWYKASFQTDWLLARDQNAKGHYINTAKGERRATTAGAGVTGTRYDCLVIDDPLDAQDAHSKAIRDHINFNWYDAAFSNRVNDENGSNRILIMQRLHEDDLTGHVLELEKKTGQRVWTQVVLPQEFDPKRRCVTPEINFADPRTEEGELLFPARFDTAFLVRAKVDLASAGYAGQHQQEPSAKDGNIFKRGHEQYVYPADVSDITRTVISWDTAFKEGQQNDYCVSLVMQLFKRGILIRDCVREKMSYPTLKATAKAQAAAVVARWGVEAVLIEDTSSGQSLVQEMRGDTVLPLVAVKPQGDKVVRANSVVPTWEAKRVFFLLDEATGLPPPWLADFLTELHTFPNAMHDDQVDAFTQGLTYIVRGGGQGFIDFMMAQLEADKAHPAVIPATGVTGSVPLIVVPPAPTDPRRGYYNGP